MIFFLIFKIYTQTHTEKLNFFSQTQRHQDPNPTQNPKPKNFFGFFLTQIFLGFCVWVMGMDPSPNPQEAQTKSSDHMQLVM